MIPLLTHINHTIEAPYLDVFGTLVKKGTEAYDVVKDSAYRFTNIDTVAVGGEMTSESSLQPVGTTPTTSKEITLLKGQKIVFAAHAGANHVIVKHDSALKKNYCVAKVSAGISEYTATQNEETIRLACGSGISGHTYSIVTPEDILEQIKYTAFLEDKESGKKTYYVESGYAKVKEDGALDNDNCYVTFHFESCKEDSNGKAVGLDIFDDRAKLSLTVYNENHEQAWWADKCYRAKVTQIKHVE